MKKRLLSVALLMGTMAANAQVGIGTATPHRSAELLIESNNRGLLIPNVALTTTKDKTTITNGNVQSLLVYATKAQGDITPGYYYWDISVWRRLTADADIPAIVVNQFENILKLEGDKVTNLIKNLIKANETLTVLGYDKAKNALSYKDEAGKTHSVELGTGAIAYNKENNSITYTDAKGNPTTLTLNKTGLTYNDKDQQLVYVDSEGKKQIVDLSKLVKANETLTVLGYDKVTGTLTYTDEAGKATTVDVKGAVKSFETVTSITTDAAKGTITFKDEAGKDTVLDIKALVKANETVTTLVREEAGKYTYTNEAGIESKITVIGDLTEVIKGRTDADLYNILKQLVNVEQTLTQLVYNTTNRQLVYTDEQNTPHNIDVDALVKENQTVTTLNGGTNIKVTEVKGANSISYTLDVPTASKDVAGVVKPGSGLDIDKDGNLTVNLETALNGKNLTGNDIIVVTDGKGAVLKTTALSVNEKAIKLEKLGGTLNLSQLQTGNAGDVLVVDAGGNVVWSAKDAVTSNTLVLNGSDLTSTVNGVGSTQTLKDKLTTEMLKDGSVTAEKLGAGKGNEGKVPVAQADGTVVYQNVSSDNVDGKALTSANNLLTVSNTAGVVLKDVILTIDQTKFELNQIGGTLQLTQIEKGGADTVLVTEVGADGKPVVKWVTKESVVTANETVTSIVDHGNGTFTYTDEKNVPVTFDANTVKVEVKEGVYTFKDGNGTTITTIDTNAIASGYSNGTSGLKAENVQAAIDELVNKINEVANTKGTLSSTDITVTEGKDALLKNVTLAIAEGAVTTDKLAPEAVTTEKIKAGKDGQVLVTITENGKEVTKWVSKTDATTNTLTKKDKTNGNTIVSTVNGVPAEIALVDKVENKVDGTTITTIVNGVESVSVDLTSAIEAGQKTTSVTNGSEKLTVVTTGAGTKDKNTEYTVDVNEAKLSLQNIGGQVTNNQIKGGNVGDVLVSTTDDKGNPITKWVTKADATTNNLKIVGNELVSTVNGVPANANLTQAITTPMLKDGAVTSEKLNAGDTGVADRVAVADAKGNVTYKTQKEVVEGNSSNKLELTGNTLTSTVNGKPSTVTLTDTSVVSSKGITGTGITVTGGANATLKDVTLAITPGTTGQVMVTSQDGLTTTWVNQNDIVKNNTSNEFTSVDNTMTSNVNGVSKTADIINSVENKLNRDNQLVTVVNGVEGTAVDLTPAIQTEQLKTRVSAKDEKVTVVGTLDKDGKTTNYVVGVVEKELNLGEMGGQVTTTQITDGAVTTEKIKAGADGQVLVTVTENGKEVTKWITKKDATSNTLEAKGDKLVSTVNGQPAELKLEGDVILKEGKTEVSKLQGNDLVTTKVQDGEVLSFEGGKWINKVPTVNTDNVTNGKALTSTEKTIAITGTGATALLKDVQIDVANGAITSEKIKDDAVTTGKIEAGKDGEVLVTIKDGDKVITKWVPQKDVVTKNTTNDLKIVDGKLVSTVNDQPATADLTNQVTKDMLQAGSVTKEKIAADVAGEGLVKNTTTGALDVNAGNGIKIVDDKVTVNAGTGLSFDKDGKLNVDFPTATVDKAGVVKPGKGLDVAADGTLTVNYDTAKTELATGNVTSNSITVTDGDNSTFKDVKLEITAGANEGDVLVTTIGADNKPTTKWVTKVEAQSLTVLSYDDKTNQLTYLDEEDKKHIISLNNGKLDYDAAKNQLTYVNSKGENSIVSLNKTDLSYSKDTKELTYTNSQGGTQTINLDTVVKENTSNVLKSDGNTLTSTVNGKESNAVSIVNSVGNTLNDKNELVTTVNGVSSTTAIDLTPAIQAGQKTTVVAKGTGVTVDTKVEGKVTTYTVSADSSTISLDGDVTGTADNTTISKLQGKELDAKDPKSGNVLVFDGNKWVTKTPTVDASNVGNAANLTTDGIIVVEGEDSKLAEGSLLKAAKLSIKAGGITTNELATNAVTSEKINAGAVTPGKIEGGTNGQVLTTTVSTEGTKTVEWKTPTVNTTDITNKGNLTSTTENLLTVKDGNGAVLQNVSLTVNEGNFNISNMKGDLTVNRIEAGNDNQVLTTVGTGEDAKVVWTNKDKPVVVKPADGKTNNSNVIVTPGTNPTTGEKEYTVDVKAAMPKVFYMPPVMFDTSKADETKELSRNLYDEYVAMFGGTGKVVDTPITGTRPPMVQSDDKATIPVYKKEDLNFFVPYYDPAVFKDVKVNADGKLTYKVIKKAKYGAFMTVVFVVK